MRSRLVAAAILTFAGAAETARAEDRRDELLYGKSIDATGVTLTDALTRWASVLEEPIVVAPALEKTVVRVLDGAAPLSWGAFKRILDMGDIVVREEAAGGGWVAFVEARRDAPAHWMSHTAVFPGERTPDREEDVTIVIPIKGSKGGKVFEAIRNVLIDDVDRVGSVLYVRGPEVVMVENRAPIADYWARLVRSFDADAPERAATNLRAEEKGTPFLEASLDLALADLAAGIDAAGTLEKFAATLKAKLVLDPAIPPTKVKILAAGPGLSWGAFRSVLDFHDVVAEEREEKGERTIVAHARKSLYGNAAHLVPRQVTADAPLRASNEYVSVEVAFEHDSGNDVFATMRGMLVRDVNRIGNISYDPKTKKMTVVDFAPNAAHYVRIARALDALSVAEKEPAVLGATLESDGLTLTVAGVSPGSAAEKAGLKTGDRVLAVGFLGPLAVNGRGLPRVLKLKKTEDLRDALKGALSGDTVVLQIERGGEVSAVTVVLGSK